MENQPLFVSVIIPVYNGEKYLAEAIQNAQNQDYHPLEIIVIDDGSTDKTAEIAAQFKDCIRYIYQQNSGPASARNHGIKVANGEVIAFLDVDDLWSDDKLKLQANYLANNPSVEIVQGLIQQIQRFEDSENSHSIFKIVSNPYQFVNLGSSIYRKSLFAKIGLFDETLRYAEDMDLLFRAWENNISKVVLDRVTLFYRKHDDNMTKGKKLVELGFVRIYKKHLDRCRQKGDFTRSNELPNMKDYIGVAPPHKEQKNGLLVTQPPKFSDANGIR
ncbi:putative Sugar transferase-a glycosyl transferase [Planktothrix sp. PCC 11201]|uniref:glycosyltransferase family 2 protein n=1 Tax=Planktothrix sp. PCC 11201 TaxID=1729650 RepID=UPI0009183686|nr:glycosyltransferase family A protein [Planktothrix sp. PCC 11201]SKB14131.1 putative Sugar transferase-a glycosyl transferase [Planktothrix sp. PCC 11201]